MQGLTKIGKRPNRPYSSGPVPSPSLQPTPNESLWRLLEDKGHTLQSFNNGQMLRIDQSLDIYSRSLKFRYTHSRSTPWRTIQTQPDHLLVREIERLLAGAPTPYKRTQLRIDGPVLVRGSLRAVHAYKKSI